MITTLRYTLHYTYISFTFHLHYIYITCTSHSITFALHLQYMYIVFKCIVNTHKYVTSTSLQITSHHILHHATSCHVTYIHAYMHACTQTCACTRQPAQTNRIRGFQCFASCKVFWTAPRTPLFAPPPVHLRAHRGKANKNMHREPCRHSYTESLGQTLLTHTHTHTPHTPIETKHKQHRQQQTITHTHTEKHRQTQTVPFQRCFLPIVDSH